MRIHDITRSLGRDTPVWPGDAPFTLSWTAARAGGANANVGAMSASTHCGTHLDAPRHVLEQGAAIEEIPLRSCIGEARLVDLTGIEAITPAALMPHLPSGTRRLLVRTGCWRFPDRMPERYPPLLPAAAAALRDAGIVLFGTDAPSVDPPAAEELPTHHVLAAAGIPVLENLLLDGVPTGVYELIALPLRLEGADASPVRAILRAP